MSFWDLSTGESLNGQTEYEAPSGGGNYLFSDGTKVGVVVDEIKWATSPDLEEYINVRFSVLAPETDAAGVKIANRKQFSKLWVNGNNKQANGDADKMKKNADKAKRFFAAIANNAGAQALLMLPGKPTDEQLAQVMMRPLTIRLGLMVGKTEHDWSGNYLSAVGPYQPAYDPVVQAQSKPVAQSGVSASAAHDSGTDIPF